MEVKGEEFIKNLEEQKKKILSSQNELDNNEKSSVYISNDSNIQDNQLDNELDDIILEDKKNNKQKYIVLAFTLLLLFLITIIIIRLVSKPVNDNTFENDNTLINDSKLENITSKDNERDIDITHNLDINKIQEDEEKIKDDSININDESTINQNMQKSDVFNINNNENTQEELSDIQKQEKSDNEEEINSKAKITKVKDLVEHIKKENIVKSKTTIIKKDAKIKKSNNKGFYIQVGAFTKEPNKNLLNKLKNSNKKYILHKVKINNIWFTKVLVGPYTNNDAKSKLNTIRKISLNPKAYILEL